jgi:hypothetical protein
MRRPYRLSVRPSFVATMLLVACAAAPGPRGASTQSAGDAQSAVETRIERYVADRDALARFYRIDATPARAERLATRAREELAALRALEFDALGLDGKVDHVLLRVELELSVFSRKIRSMRAAITQRYAKTLASADSDIGTELARRLQQCQTQEISGDDD